MGALSKEQLQEYQQRMDALQRGAKTLIMATLAEDGVPETSYTPYAQGDAGCFYVFISDLASHTANLRRTPQLSVLFIQDERDSRNLYARERLTWRCCAREVAVSSTEYEQGLALLRAEQGSMIDMLSGLSDFRLFALEPVSGAYVVGFGKAFEVDAASGRLVHIDEQRLVDRKEE